MPGLGGTLYFGGTEVLEPTGRDDLIAGGIDPDIAGDEEDDEYDSEEPKAYENPQTGERCLKRAVSPSADGQPALKRFRVAGGKAAIPKPVLANYDSDDGRIIELKQQGYTDTYICERMAQEGRMSYVAKTISSRWLRLRKAIKEAEDNQLDDELSDWHDGEDHTLKSCVDRMEEETKAEMQKVNDRKWAKISEQMAKTLGVKKYTAKACLERFGAVEDGTALLPIELDPDTEGRKVKRQVRITEAKRRRAEQVAEAQRVEEEKKKRLGEKKLKSQESNRIRILSMQEKEAKQAEEERVKNEKRDTIEKLREARKTAVKDAKIRAAWEKKVHTTELALYKTLAGVLMPGHARTGGRRRPGSKRETSQDDDIEHGDDGEEYDGLSDDDDAEMGDDESEGDIEGDTGSKAGSSATTKTSKRRGDGSGAISGSSTGTQATKKPTRAITPPVNEETLLNPRSIMAADELEALLFNRKMPRRGGNETHPQLVARLAAADATLATQELDELLRKFWDKGKGSKVAKVRRLQNHEANASAAGLEGIKSTDPKFKKGYEGYVGEYSCWIEDDDEEMADE